MKTLTFPKLACVAALALMAIPAVASAQHHDRGSRYHGRSYSHGHGHGHSSYHGGGHYDRGDRYHHHGSKSRWAVSFGFSSGGYYGDGAYGAVTYGRGYGYRPYYYEPVYPVYRSTRHYSYAPYCAPPVVYSPPVVYDAPVYYSGRSYGCAPYRQNSVYVSSRFHYRR